MMRKKKIEFSLTPIEKAGIRIIRVFHLIIDYGEEEDPDDVGLLFIIQRMKNGEIDYRASVMINVDLHTTEKELLKQQLPGLITKLREFDVIDVSVEELETLFDIDLKTKEITEY